MLLRKIITIALFLMIIYVIVVSCLYSCRNQMVFWPLELEDGYCFNFEEPHEEFYLSSSNGNQINAIFFQSQIIKRGVILYLHGNSRHLGYWGKYAGDFLNRGYDVLAIDYQGYGKSDGFPSEQALYDDAITAYNYLRTLYDYNEIIIYGRSLGTGAASHLAKEKQARTLILETPFYNLEEVFESKAYFIPYPLKLEHNFPNNEHLIHVKMPVHIVHGTADELIDYSSAKKLERFFKAGDSFTTIEGGKHKNLSIFDSYQLFLDRTLSIDSDYFNGQKKQTKEVL